MKNKIKLLIKWIKLKLNLFKYEKVYTIRGVWNIKQSSGHIYNEYCRYFILYCKELNHYKLYYEGYDAINHPLYDHLFLQLLNLSSYKVIILDNEIYDINDVIQKALKDEKYEVVAELTKYKK